MANGTVATYGASASTSNVSCTAALVYRLMFCFVKRKVATTVIPPQVQVASVLYRSVRNRERARKEKLKAPLATKVFSPGDVFHVPPEGPSCDVEALYGLPHEQLLHIVPDPDGLETATFHLAHKSTFSGSGSQNMFPTQDKPIKKERGVTLALRMAGRTYPFRARRCNSRHYTDYLTYGKTFGSYRTPTYLPASQSCPVFAPLNNQTDTNSPDFFLLDGNGNRFELNPPLRASPSLSRRGDGSMRSSGSKRLRLVPVLVSPAPSRHFYGQ